MIKVGIAGLGIMGLLHLNYHLENDNCKVTAICDVDEKKITSEKYFTDFLNAKVKKLDLDKLIKYKNIEKIITDKNIDVIDICLPVDLHADIAIKAMNSGKHVLCEKPMTNNVDDAKKMVEVAENEGVTLMIGYQTRFWPEYIYLRETIQSERLGKLFSLSLSRIAPHPLSDRGWLLEEEISKGAILDVHIHDTDFLVSLFGKPQKVISQGFYKKSSGGYSHVLTQYFYKDVPIVNATGGWMAPESFGFNVSYSAMFEKGVIEYKYYCLNSLKTTLIEYIGKKKIVKEKLNIEPNFLGDVYKREIDYFVDCVQNNKKPEECMPESTLKSLEVLFKEIDYIKKEGSFK